MTETPKVRWCPSCKNGTLERRHEHSQVDGLPVRTEDRIAPVVFVCPRCNFVFAGSESELKQFQRANGVKTTV